MSPRRWRTPTPPPRLIAPQDVESLRQAGRINAHILATLRDALRPEVSAYDLERMARGLLLEAGAKSPFLGYQANPDQRPYPAVLSISLNDEVVHGIPHPKKIIREGDLVKLDCGTAYQGLIADSAVTVAVGQVEPRLQTLIEGTQAALMAGIAAACPGGQVGDISAAIERVLRHYKINTPPQLGGHGVGYSLHGTPHIPNHGKAQSGLRLQAGMALAIEPMGMYGRPEVALLSDRWTVVAKDRSISAHAEHTILIHEHGPEILTQLPY